MVTENWVNIGSGNGLLPHSTKPLPEPMLTYHEFGAYLVVQGLTPRGRVHICISKPTIIGSDNGLSPDRRQAVIWTNAGILLIGPLGTNSSEILIKILAFSFKKMHLKMSSAKWRPFRLGLNVLSHYCYNSISAQWDFSMSGFSRTWCVIMGLLLESHQVTTCNISCCLKVELVFDQFRYY